jgi:hypothetical protein
MCRYAHQVYKSHFACFHCRKMFRQAPLSDLPGHRRPSSSEKRVVPCPECGIPMNNMGLDFKAPPHDDLKQWRKVEILFHHGFAYHSCGCGPGRRPGKLREVDAFLATRPPRTEGERLRRAIALRANSRHGKQRRLPGEVQAEHPLAADARKLKQRREAAQIAASLLRKRRNATA